MDKIEYTPIVIHSDRKTIAIEIGKKGVIVRAPNRMSEDAVISFLKQKEDWIQKSLLKMASNQSSIANLPKLTKSEINSLADRALKVIPVKVKHYAKQLNVDYGRITIRCQRTRWGSCSSKGNLNFNCLLALFPIEIIDSVVVHELCHRKHMNHSPQFYAEIEKVFPEYKRCNKWLKDNGGVYRARLT